MKPIEDWQHGGFAVYVHWPFCKAKCPYCDFNSHVRVSVDQRAWTDAYLAEIDRVSAETGPRVVRSVFFGGGTPSLMDPAVVGAVLERIGQRWQIANDLEVTLEANPTSVEADRFRGYASVGVNRLSLGIQALDDADLRALGRQHSAKEALAAYDFARETFGRVSCDLIYARQNQTLEGWGSELNALLSRAPDHLSLYQLTIEDGTAFGDLHKRNKLKGLPSEDLAADMYDLTSQICAEAGLASYEVSNYARTGSESRHNLVYWRMGDYVGIGPGAHGRLTLDGKRLATSTIRSPESWLAAIGEKAGGELPREELSARDQAVEYLMMSLRLAEGCDASRIEALAPDLLSKEGEDRLLALGLLSRLGTTLKATPSGRLVLNRLFLELTT